MEHFKVYVYSTRSNSDMGIDAMIEWFIKYGFKRIDDLYFPTEKPPALLTIDDRGITFNGTFPSIDEIKRFKPWYK